MDGGLQGRGKEALGAMSRFAHCAIRRPMSTSTTWCIGSMRSTHTSNDWSSRSRSRPRRSRTRTTNRTCASSHLSCAGRVLSGQRWRSMSKARGVPQSQVIVQDGDDLEQTTGREVYRDCRIGEIRASKGQRVAGAACSRWRALLVAWSGMGRRRCRGRSAGDDPPDDP